MKTQKGNKKSAEIWTGLEIHVICEGTGQESAIIYIGIGTLNMSFKECVK